jgi:hypothetical protein
MSYTNACFISYKRPPQRVHQRSTLQGPRYRHLWAEFADAFQRKLEGVLSTHLPVYRDDRLSPGDPYPQTLAENLCKSVCMVALIVPEYFESAWCTAEWTAMESFEQKRLGRGATNQLIFPVICTGDPIMLRPKFGRRQEVDLRYIVNPATQLNSVRARNEIIKIATKIDGLIRTIPSADIDCDDYSLNVGSDISSPQVTEPSPFER